MTKVFFPHLLPRVQPVPLLFPFFGERWRGGTLFMEHAFKFYTKPAVEVVRDAAAADFILLPHNFSYVAREQGYIGEYEKVARRVDKPLIIFAYGDSDADIPVRNAVVFRTSQYRYKKRKNEIIMPAYVEDLGDASGISFREKSPTPSIGFCGWGEYHDIFSRAKATLTGLLIDMRKTLSRQPELEVHKKGLFFRRRILEKLQQSDRVHANFIVRPFYSHHRRTVVLSPERIRKEFIDTIKNSDFSLSVKGDGNYSLRFYEILSLARIPVLVDTECVLPLEDIIDYRKFVLRIDYRDIERGDEIIRDCYDSFSDDAFMAMQHAARKYFEEFLRIDAFFRFIFSRPEYLSRAAS